MVKADEPVVRTLEYWSKAWTVKTAVTPAELPENPGPSEKLVAGYAAPGVTAVVNCEVVKDLAEWVVDAKDTATPFNRRLNV
jgi:hypothetical protein